MKTSARNTIAGTVSKITKGAVNSEVHLRTEGGVEIVAIITNPSVDALELKVGAKAFALIKASWVILGTDLHEARISTRNLLCGTVASVSHGAVNGQVQVKLSSGETLTSIITEESLKGLDLKLQDHVCAAIKASSVILAVE